LWQASHPLSSRRCGKWIFNPDAADDLADVEVFREQDPALDAGGGLDDETVPERDSIALAGIDGPKDRIAIQLVDPSRGPL